MARIPPLDYSEITEEVRTIWDQQVKDHGRMTNMKKTLAHSYESLYALMTWYPLFHKVKEFLGEYPALLFAAAISSQTDCLVCSTFFRRILIDKGKDTDNFQANELEQLVVDYGRQLAKDPHGVHKKLYKRLTETFSNSQIVTLTAFAGLMIATNIFNNALRIDLDEYLYAYRKEGEK